ncbi:leucine-rich repeat extensin-like protein 4 [Iris pallida]|uniref:Leucine-rich repeat extensin-like protein 4 n=1 Tax=Iris pallida TaxID=29817 RepID=A0AAX6GER0_IRIPA|nr:leucine-rich repeat extensin-like protein 4 [Iris pallida]
MGKERETEGRENHRREGEVEGERERVIWKEGESGGEKTEEEECERGIKEGSHRERGCRVRRGRRGSDDALCSGLVRGLGARELPNLEAQWRRCW